MSRNSGALELLLASLIWGFVPSIIILSSGDINPIFFIILYWGSGGVGLLIYLLFTAKHLMRGKNFFYLLDVFRNRKYLYENPRSTFDIFGERSMLAPFQQLLSLALTLSFAYVHPAVGAVLFESWPIFFILLLAKYSDKEYFFRKRDIYLVLLTIIALSLVAFSDGSSDASIFAFSWEYMLGIGLIIFGAICLLQNIPRILQARNIVPHLSLTKSRSTNVDDVSNCILVLNLLSRIFGCLLMLAILILSTISGIGDGFSGMTIFSVLAAIIGGAFVGVGGEVFTAFGNVKGKELKVQMLRYLTPAFGGIFVIILTTLNGSLDKYVSSIPNIDHFNWILFAIGLAGIIGTNIFANFSHSK